MLCRPVARYQQNCLFGIALRVSRYRSLDIASFTFQTVEVQASPLFKTFAPFFNSFGVKVEGLNAPVKKSRSVATIGAHLSLLQQRMLDSKTGSFCSCSSRTQPYS